MCSLTMKHTRVVSLNARQAKPGVHLVDTTRVCFIVNEHTTKCSCFYHTCLFKMQKLYSFMWWNMSGFIWKLGINFAVCIKWIDETWWNNRLLLVPNCYEVVTMVATMVAMVVPLWCPYIEINKAVSQWLLTFNLCVSVTWPLTCAFLSLDL